MFGPSRLIAIMKGKYQYLIPRTTYKNKQYQPNQNYHNVQPTQHQLPYQQPIQISLEQTIINLITLAILTLIIYLWLFTNY